MVSSHRHNPRDQRFRRGAVARSAAASPRRSGLTISCDLNYRKNLWRWGKSAAEVMPEIARRVDIVIANEEDVQMTLGIEAGVDVHAGKLGPEPV